MTDLRQLQQQQQQLFIILGQDMKFKGPVNNIKK